MSIAIFFDQRNPERWVQLLSEALPETAIEVYPEIKDPGKVTFALCWKPEKDVLSQFPNLRVVQSIGAGVDHIFNSQQLPDAVKVCRIVDPQLTQDLLEYVIAGIMGYIRGFPKYSTDQVNNRWKPKRYKTIAQTSVTVLGLGVIGSFIAQELAKIGFKVRGWSRSRKTVEGVKTYDLSELLDAINESDVLINVLPLTPETENILDKSLMSHLADHGYVINVGRGQHLIENDLIDLIEGNKLSGALLDVFRTEPLPEDHPFWSNSKITITPHVASITTLENAVDIAIRNWKNLQNEKPLEYEVNAVLRY